MLHLLRRSVIAALFCGFLLTMPYGAAAQQAGKTASKHAVTKKTKAPASADKSMRELKEMLLQQKELILQQQSKTDELQNRLQRTEKELSDTRQKLAQTDATTQEVRTKTATVDEAKTQIRQVQSDLSDVKAAMATSTQSIASTESRVKKLEEPSALRYKGLTLTPGGFLETDFIARSRNQNADIANGYTTAPLDDSSNANLSEFRASARASRLTLLATANAGWAKLTGYYEMDFLGAAPTSNQVQVNAWAPRLRQAWAQAELPGGWTVSTGQFWSLITTNRKGIALRTEFLPLVVDGNYHVGYNFVRQAAVRVTKNFNDRVWAAFEIANSETTVTGVAPANLMGLANSPTDASGVLILPYSANYSSGVAANKLPDFLGKVAFEPGWGHYEIKLLGRTFRDRVAGTASTSATTNVSYGGGVGAAFILPLKPKMVDLVAEGMIGRGIGRYGASSMPDNTLNPITGKLLPLRQAQFMGGIEIHPTPRLDFFAYGGEEYTQRLAKLTATGTAAGYGSPLTSFASCTNEVALNSCSGSNKNIYEATGGFWYRFYKGPAGILQYGNQVAYFHRSLWRGVGDAPTGSNVAVYTTLRYYLP